MGSSNKINVYFSDSFFCRYFLGRTSDSDLYLSVPFLGIGLTTAVDVAAPAMFYARSRHLRDSVAKAVREWKESMFNTVN